MHPGKAVTPTLLSDTARPKTPLVFEVVYRQHFEFVYRSAARLGGPGFDAEDAAQEVFVVVGRQLDRFDHSCALTSWLYGITINVARSQRRKLRLRRLFEWSVQAPDVPALRSVDRAEVLDAQRIAYEILDKMGAKKREVFILAELEDLSCDEIARLVGSKTETVWSRLHYARTEFAERLARRQADEGGGR